MAAGRGRPAELVEQGMAGVRPMELGPRSEARTSWTSRIAWGLFALAVLGLAAASAYSYLVAAPALETVARLGRPWYGNWAAAAFAAIFFSAFVLAFLRSPRPRAWRHLGMAEAYLMALFAEMFGLPLTIYLLGSVLGVNLGFGMLEGHLWAVLLYRLGVLPLAQGVAVVMAASSALIILGLALMAAGWWQTWRARGGLVTSGLYRFARHPQYTGFLLVIVGFLIQWPTLPTVVLFPILVATYYRLARREELEMTERLGERYAAYRARTPMLLPGWPAQPLREASHR